MAVDVVYLEDDKSSDTMKMVVIGIIVGIVLGGAIGYMYASASGGSGKGALPQDEVATRTLDFVNTNLLQPGATAKIESITEKSGVLHFNFTINSASGLVNAPAYVTKDGSLFFLQPPINMSKPLPSPVTPPATEHPNTASGEINAAALVDDDPAAGDPNAKVIVVEFSDFQCPFCAKALQTVKDLKEFYGDQILFVYRDFPLHSIHPLAGKAAEAAQCANEQGRFWEYHDMLFEKQSDWATGGAAKFNEYARNLGLDSGAFVECLDSGKYTAEVEADRQAGIAIGVTGTPTFVINGQKVSGAVPLDILKDIIDSELAKTS